MLELWKSRVRTHQQQQAKYLRLVFNDHFVLVLIILFGAGLYAYSQFVRQMTSVPWWLVPGLALILTIAATFGRLATLTEAADQVFLLPQAKNFLKYLFRARRYSLGLPTVVLLLLSGASWPLLAKLHEGWPALVTLAIGLLVFKDADLWVQLLTLYRVKVARGFNRLTLFAFVFVAVLLGLYLHPAVTMLAALALDGLLRWRLADWFAKAPLDYDGMIQSESDRMGRIYRFYNLFTDVPGLNGQVKRRKYLDWLTAFVSKKPANTWRFIYLRGFLRGTEYSGLYIRLTLIGAIILALIQQWWLALLLAIVFIYLVGFQLLPFYYQYDEIIFTHLFPVGQGQKQHSFQRLVAVLLSVQTVIFTVAALLVGQWVTAGAILLVGLVFVVAFTAWYLPLRFNALRK